MASDDDMPDIMDEPDMDAPAESDAVKVQQRIRWWARYTKKFSFLDASDKAKAHFIASREVQCSPCGTHLLIGRWTNNITAHSCTKRLVLIMTSAKWLISGS